LSRHRELRSVPQRSSAFLLGAVSAAVERLSILDAVADDPAAAVGALRRAAVDCAFETVERHRSPAHRYLKTAVVVVAAYIALGHLAPPEVGRQTRVWDWLPAGAVMPASA
jgi:hypothetical protein